jgi:hypothetical protein
MSEKIGKAIKTNLFRIEEIGGAGNLSYKLSMLRNSLCLFHVLLDNDDAGRKAYESAEKDGLAGIKNTTFANCIGMRESEFEDCLNSNVYKNAIKDEFGVDLSDSSFKGNEKWSNRMKRAFNAQGKQWTEQIEKQVKSVVANTISNDPSISLSVHKRSSIDALVIAIEELIKVD